MTWGLFAWVTVWVVEKIYTFWTRRKDAPGKVTNVQVEIKSDGKDD